MEGTENTSTETARKTGFDYYAGLARDLHEIADRISALADLAAEGYLPPRLFNVIVGLTVSGDPREADTATPVVDLLAEVFGGEAANEYRTYVSEYLSRPKVGEVRVTVATAIPNLPDEAPRGTDDAEEHVPPPEFVEGHATTGRQPKAMES